MTGSSVLDVPTSLLELAPRIPELPPRSDSGDASEGRFCEDCPYRGSAIGELLNITYVTYKVALSRKAAAGKVVDAEGGYSKPINLPFEPREFSPGLTAMSREVRQPVYSPDEFEASNEVAIDHVLDSIRDCAGTVQRKTLILRRTVKSCPALTSFMMGRGVRKAVEAIDRK